MDKPIIAITMGDPLGIGPEIIIKSLQNSEIYDICIPVVVGDLKVLAVTNDLIKSELKINEIKSDFIKDDIQYGEIHCIDLDLIANDFKLGEVTAEAGNAAFHYLKKAVDLAQKKQIDAICTAPLNKEALHKAGHVYPGHTEILAKLTGTKHYSMMLSVENLNVIHVTTHIGLIEAIETVTPDKVYQTIILANNVLKNSGIQKPKVGVCGINPHAGENGLFGYGEEDSKITPAIKDAQEKMIDVQGPLPADTLFFRAKRGDFDVVVAMYHDQGHGPVKVMGLEGVNVTVGLPIIRTSVDHGTAFDIAGKNLASDTSMKAAIKKAMELSSYKARDEH